jgi:hypothetical protein
MPLTLADRVRDTTTTTGTGTVTLSGTAPTGYQNFSVIGNGNTTYYTINAGSQWEVGIGTYSSTGPTLSRDTVLESSNANALVNFLAGVKDVFVTYPSDKSVIQDGSSITAGTAVLGVSNGGTGVNTSTGTGSVVLSTSPTLVTPTIGAASATSIANALGAVGTPSYTFTGDTNTGMWSPTADTVAFSTAGSERLRVTSAGNVGIGTTTANNRLSVSGDMFIQASSTGQNSQTIRALSGQTGNLFQWQNSGGTVLGAINASGNLGVGTTTPSSKVDIAEVTSPTLTFTRTGSADGNGIIRSIGNTGAVNAQITMGGGISDIISFATNGSERARIDGSGNLLVGTTTASSYKLNVQSGSAFLANFSGPANAFIQVSDGTVTGRMQGQSSVFAVGTSSNHPLSFITNVTERMRIDSSGNLLVGTTTANGKISVVGDQISVAGGAGSGNLGIQIKGTVLSAIPAAQVQGYIATGDSAIGVAGDLLIAPRTSVAASIRFITGTSPAERMRIDSSGNVGIGTTTPSEKLNVSGNILATGNITAYSDIHLKENIEQIGGALKRVSAVRGVTYTRNDLEDKARRYGGVVAQELEQVLPEAISQSGSMKAVDYNAVVGLLIEAIKELKAEVEELKGSKS